MVHIGLSMCDVEIYGQCYLSFICTLFLDVIKMLFS